MVATSRDGEGELKGANILDGILTKTINNYTGSAWVPAYAGTHASGRAGQHFK